MTAELSRSGQEPQLGGGKKAPDLTRREPQLGGLLLFDPAIWGLLTDASRLAKRNYIDALHPTACESYARKLIRFLQDESLGQPPINMREGWPRATQVEMKAGAIFSLGILGGRVSETLRDRIADTLLNSFAVETDENILGDLAEALGQIGCGYVEDQLLYTLSNAEGTLRRRIILSLGRIGADAALDRIWQMQAEFESEDDVASAVEALGMIGARQAPDERDEIFRYLTGTFMRGREGLRCAAARALGHLHDERARDVLVKTAIQGQGLVQSAAIQGLGLLGDDHAVPPLIGVLVASGDSLIGDVVDTLVQIGLPSLNRVLAVASHPEKHVRQAAVEVLGRLGDPAAGAVLIDALRDVSEDVRREAVAALGQFGPEIALVPLLEMLEDPDYEVRKVTAAVLGNLGDRRAVGALCIALWDVDMNVRWYAAYALGVLGDTRAIDSLCQALGDRSDHVASTAANSLVTFGEASVSALQGCLNSPKERMRSYAASALQRIGTQDARAALIRGGRK